MHIALGIVLMFPLIVAKQAGLPRLSPFQLLEALGRVLILSLLGRPCPYQGLFGVPESLGYLRKQDIANRGCVILLGTQEAAICGVTYPPSLHSPSLAGMACSMLDVTFQNSWTASPGACWQWHFVFSSFVTT